VLNALTVVNQGGIRFFPRQIVDKAFSGGFGIAARCKPSRVIVIDLRTVPQQIAIEQDGRGRLGDAAHQSTRCDRDHG